MLCAVPRQGLGQAIQARGFPLPPTLRRGLGGREDQRLGAAFRPGSVPGQQVAFAFQYLNFLPPHGGFQSVAPVFPPTPVGRRILRGLRCGGREGNPQPQARHLGVHSIHADPRSSGNGLKGEPQGFQTPRDRAPLEDESNPPLPWIPLHSPQPGALEPGTPELRAVLGRLDLKPFPGRMIGAQEPQFRLRLQQ